MKKKLKLLGLDDEYSIAKGFEKLLKGKSKHFERVIFETSVKEFFKRLNEESFDVIILDLVINQNLEGILTPIIKPK